MLTHAVCMTLVLAASAYTARGCAARCWGLAEARRRGPFHPPPGGPLGEAIRTKQTVQVADVAATQAYDASRAGRVSAAAWPANARIRAALRHQSALGVAGFGQGLIGFFGARIARVALAQRAIAEGRGSSGTALDDPSTPGMGAGDTVEVAAAVAGGLPGSTTTRVPTRMRR